MQISTGQLPKTAVPPEQAMAMLQHWLIVFALVLLLVFLAFWDAWEGIRQLRGFLDTVEKEELSKIQGHLDEHLDPKSLLKDLE
jgi:hypothetical protein